MPINLKSLQQRGAMVPVQFYDMESEIWYDPVRFTPAFRTEYTSKESELRSAVKDTKDPTPNDIHRPNAILMTMLIKDWDIVGVDGKKLKIDPDAILENLPDALTRHIIWSVWSDVNQLGKSKTRTDSNSAPGSNQTES